MAEDIKKGYMVYTLKICFNQDTDEIEYIAEGLDEDDVAFTPITPYDLSADVTQFFTWEDMETIRKLYDIPKT